MSPSAGDVPPAGKTDETKEQTSSSATDSEEVSELAPVEKGPAAAAPQAAAPFGNDAPDGGTTAWLCVLGAWCCAFCSFGWINSAF